MVNPKTILAELVQAVPSLTVIYVWIMSISLDQWYKGSGTTFILLQIAYLIWKWRKEAKKKNAES